MSFPASSPTPLYRLSTHPMVSAAPLSQAENEKFMAEYTGYLTVQQLYAATLAHYTMVHTMSLATSMPQPYLQTGTNLGSLVNLTNYQVTPVAPSLNSQESSLLSAAAASVLDPNILAAQVLAKNQHSNASNAAVVANPPTVANETTHASRTSRRPVEESVKKKASGAIRRVTLKSALYKTELCRNFVLNNSCQYGLKCQFAHGQDDKRTLQLHNYKTKKCISFKTTGTCRYNDRCRFSHAPA